MERKTLIFKFFQKANLLTVRQKDFANTVSSLFSWLITTDQAANDKTTKFFSSQTAQAKIFCRQPAIIAGLEEVEFVLKKYPQISFKKIATDGQLLRKNQEIAKIQGDSKTILALERTILNLLQRLSGIATQTNRMVKELSSSSTAAPFISSTRKTVWGQLDKKAVALGGGLTHRLNLADEILIKDNHLNQLSGKEKAAVKKALSLILPQIEKTLIEIEVATPMGAQAALSSFSKDKGENYLTIMFDNWQPEAVKNALEQNREKYDTSQVIFEASGNIEKKNLNSWAKTGVDLISIGALTHSAKAADFSLTLSKT